MFAQMTNALDFQGKALVLRAERQRLIASNIANADTPGYAARDLDFRRAMADAAGDQAVATPTRATALSTATTDARHIAASGPASTGDLADRNLTYVMRSQPSMDGNTVDLNQERSNFVDNAVRYESTLRFINGHAKTILSAITGQ